MGLHLAVARAACIAPHAVAIRQGDTERSWREVADRIARLAAGLLRAGLRRGDRLAILAANTPEHMEITYAALWAGLVVVPLNTRLSVIELTEIAEDAGAAAIATCRTHLATALTVADAAGITLTIGLDSGDAGRALADLLDAAPIGPALVDGRDPAGIYYTGGTTGRPKGVELSHGAFTVRSLDMMADMQFGQGSVYLHAAPYFHLADCGVGHGLTYAAGTHVFLPDPAANFVDAALDRIGPDRVTAINLVPTMLAALIDAADGTPALHGFRSVAYGAAPLPAALMPRLLDAFPAATFRQFYGQTEACGPCLVLPPEAHVPGGAKLRKAGRPTASSLVRIAGPDGTALPAGSPGEIGVRGPGVMTGYWRRPDLTAQTIRDGWLCTGDVGIMDEDGYVEVVDRLKDMIVTGGENVFSAEVEAALGSHPAVASVAVIGVPHPRWGEAVHAVVVRRPGARPGADELISHVRTRIAGYKCPKSVAFAEALPLSAMGKVRKTELLALWNAAREAPAGRGRDPA